MYSLESTTRSRSASHRFGIRGFTLIELMIVISVIAIILALALPTYMSYSTRAKVGEALVVAMGAKTSVAESCQSDRGLTSIDNDRVGFNFTPSTWVDSIVVSGSCSQPIILLTTRNTGADTDPVVQLEGSLPQNSARITWVCSLLSGTSDMVPSQCRS